MFPPSGSGHTQIVSINSSDLVNGVAQAQLRFYKKDFDTFSMRPTTMHDSVAGDPMWFVAESGDNAHIWSSKMTNVLSNSPVLMNTSLSVTPYLAVANPLNPDGTVITNDIDSRILKAAEANNIIVATHAVGVSTTQDAAQWYKIDVSSGTPVLADQGRVAAGNKTYIYYPAIDINAYGNIGMTFMQSGPIARAISCQCGSRLARFRMLPVRCKRGRGPVGTGQAKYADFGQRAGDLSGINVDQSDGSFWAASEFATPKPRPTGTAIANFTSAKTDTWSGSGSDSNWMTAANWVGNVAPVAGDNLVFPAGAAQLSTTNNFPAGTGFNSVIISGNGYSFAGNAW